MAAAIRIRWLPPTAQVKCFRVYRLVTPTDSPFLIAEISGAQSGPNWDGLKFFYDDPQGTPTNAYKVEGVDANLDVVADTGVFTPQPNVVYSLPTRVRVDTHFQGTDNLRYTAPGGAGIAYAKIAVYRKIDFDQGRLGEPLFRTETDTEGRWKTCVFLEPGFEFVVHFSKQSEWGPDTRVITVAPVSS